jgi:hypothetical protein
MSMTAESTAVTARTKTATRNAVAYKVLQGG